MSKTRIKVGQKFYMLDTETNEMVLIEEENTEKKIKETTLESNEDIESKIEKAADEVIKKIGLEDLQKKVDEIAEAQTKSTESKKEVNKLLDLEKLMNKGIDKMTSEEKTIGFFQAILKNDTTVLKALSEGTAADGGYLFPDEFRAEIIRDLEEGGYLRKEVNVVTMLNNVMNIPSLASRPKVTWTSENATKSTTTAHFGQKTLTVFKMAAILYASDELIDDSTHFDIVKMIIGFFAEAIGQEEDKVIAQGDGTTQPTGLTTARADGTIASRAIAGSTVDFTDIIDIMGDLPGKYHKGAKWYIHRNRITDLRKIKDGNNRFYWADPVSQGEPPTLYGYEVVEVNDLPESMLFFGDLKKAYWLGDRQKMTVKISQDTTQAFTNDQTAIRVVSRIAGNVVLGEAVKALTGL